MTGPAHPRKIDGQGWSFVSSPALATRCRYTPRLSLIVFDTSADLKSHGGFLLVQNNQTFQLRAYCTRDGYRRLDEVLAECATLYNAALQEWRDAYRMRGVSVSLYSQMRELTGVRHDDPEGWGSRDVRVGRGVLRRLDEARKAFFRRVKAGEKPGYPRFRSQRRWKTIEIKDPRPAMLRIMGTGELSPLGSTQQKSTSSTGIPIIGQEGVSPCVADSPWGSIDRRIARGVSPCVADSPQADCYPRHLHEVSPCVADSPVPPLSLSTSAEVSPCVADSPASLSIKGLPTIRMKLRQPLPPREDLKAITITRRGRRLYVNLTFAVEKQPLEPSDEAVGIDLGVTDRMALSTGELVERRPVDRERVEDLQRRRSRCRRGSRKYRKLSRVLANHQDRVRVKNRNDCHQATTAIVRRFGRIAVEDLRIKNMTASAAGTIEEPGTNVAAKAGLNRSELEQTWGIIRKQLTYKAEWAGRELAAVDPRNTSRTCSSCGVVDARSRDRKEFRCTSCGMEMDADVNAAINILRRSWKKRRRLPKCSQPS